MSYSTQARLSLGCHPLCPPRSHQDPFPRVTPKTCPLTSPGCSSGARQQRSPVVQGGRKGALLSPGLPPGAQPSTTPHPPFALSRGSLHPGTQADLGDRAAIVLTTPKKKKKKKLRKDLWWSSTRRNHRQLMKSLPDCGHHLPSEGSRRGASLLIKKLQAVISSLLPCVISLHRRKAISSCRHKKSRLQERTSAFL